MSMQVSYKKQILFFTLLVFIVLLCVEGILRVYDPTLTQCNFINTSIDKEVRDKICREQNSLVFDPENGKIIEGTEDKITKINNYGFRGNDIEFQKDKGTYRIFSVGGSTTFGSGVQDDETYPYFLQQIFHQNGFDKVEVINAGVGGMWSYQEKNLIDRKIYDFEPDLIIIYDGWNDVIRSSLEKDLENKILNENREQFIYSGNEITQFLKNSQMLKAMNRIIVYQNDLVSYNNRTIATYDYSNSDMKIFEWKNRWIETCKENPNVKFVVILQPMAGSGEKKMTDLEKLWYVRYDNQGILREFEKYNLALPEISQRCELVLDYRNIFDHVENTIYIDNGHVLPLGNKILAGKIFDDVKYLVE